MKSMYGLDSVLAKLILNGNKRPPNCGAIVILLHATLFLTIPHSQHVFIDCEIHLVDDLAVVSQCILYELNDENCLLNPKVFKFHECRWFLFHLISSHCETVFSHSVMRMQFSLHSLCSSISLSLFRFHFHRNC